MQFTKIWEGPKDDRKNIKLKVEFKYPEVVPVRSAAAENVDGVRNRLSRNEASNNASSGNVLSAPSNSPEVIFTELQNLRKKYDAVVEYTVHLTAERDAIVSQLETSQRELVKEKSKKKTNVATADGDNSRLGDKKSADKVNEFSMFRDLFIHDLFFPRDFLCSWFYLWLFSFSFSVNISFDIGTVLYKIL